jgi:DNA-binding CsgD family transcriptional regulator
VAALQAAVVQGVRARGQVGVLPRVLTQQAWNAIAMLDWPVAVPAADEAVRLAKETGQPIWQAAALTGQAMIAGLRGDAATADLLSADAERIVLPLRLNAVLCGIQFTRGVSALGAGRYDDAFAHLRRMLDPADPSFQAVQSTWSLGDLAEAAAHTDRVEEARELVERFRPAAGVTPSPWTQVALRYARPLLAPDRTAEERFREALAGDLVRWPSYRARLLLEYGTWLRRRRRVADSRVPLRDARDACDALGLAPWAERARQELRATGEASTEPLAQAWATLSPQEFQIAQLAAAGLSNREIGQRLYLSHRTVGSHLYRMFPKLGITSRAQLGAVLGTDPQPINA